MLSSDIDDEIGLDGTPVPEEPNHEPAALPPLREVLALYAVSGDVGDLEPGFALAREMLGELPQFQGGGPVSVEELRCLAIRVPEFGELLDDAADAAGEALARACEELWTALGLTSPVPGWTAPEHEAARMAFACACQPEADRGSAWLPANLRRISAARLARLLCGELARSERPWLRLLGGHYGSLRHRCAPRTLLRSRGLSDLLRDDPECHAAVISRLERWLMVGSGLQDLPVELEAAVVHARTPARLA